jgi:hypothetical protein
VKGPNWVQYPGRNKAAKMDEKIYIDASQPASLLDGPNLTDCPTLQEAVIAWHRLPSERQRTARIRTAANVFTAKEIDRLYYGPEPEGEPTVAGTAATVPPAPTVSVSAPPQRTGQVEAASPPRSDDVTIAPAPETVPPAAANNSEQPHVPFTSGAAFPFTDDHSADIPPTYYAAARRNLAMQMSGPVEVFPPLQPPLEVSVSSQPIAGTAPKEIIAPDQSNIVASEASATAALSSTSSMNADTILLENPERLYAEMLRRIEALERTITDAPSRSHGIGHNNPPEPLEPELLSETELRGVRLAVAVLKAQPPAPRVPRTEVVEAVAFLAAVAARLKQVAGYVGKQADVFVTEATKELGKRAVQSPFWLAVLQQLPQLADAAQHWLRSLGAH